LDNGSQKLVYGICEKEENHASQSGQAKGNQAKQGGLVKAFSMVSVVARSLAEKSASGNGQEVGNVE
tara:strand:+ start:354 stop:554 length:201 start_codon:yes stop_codon:yes gene_type:complete